MNRVEVSPRIIDLSVFSKHLGKVPTGTYLDWGFLCNTHGPDSTVAALPHDIETDPKKLRDWIDTNINPPKCSVLCNKTLGDVSPLPPFDRYPYL